MYRMVLLTGLLAGAGAAAAMAQPPETLVESLCRTYDPIRTLSCSIRKDTTGGGETLHWLTRVYFQRPDHIHVENVAPMQRRIIADGRRLCYYEQGLLRGFARPITELDPDWLTVLRTVPGSPLDQLAGLKGVPETPLPATVDHPLRRAYQATNLYVIVSCDAQRRLCRLESFTNATARTPVTRLDYGAFQQVAPDIWLPCLHKAIRNEGATRIEETRRIDNLVVNQPIPGGLFDAAAFFKGVEFTPDFAATTR